MKYLTLLFLTVFMTASADARDVTKTAAPSADQPSNGTLEDMSSRNLNRNSAQKEYEEDAVTSGQSATDRNSRNLNIRKRCQTMDGEWLRPIDVGYDGCMSDSRTFKK